MPSPTLEEKLIVELRKHVLAALALEVDLVKLGKDIRSLQRAHQKLVAVAGSRDGLAVLFLPEGMTLTQAWDQDYKNLRTGN